MPQNDETAHKKKAHLYPKMYQGWGGSLRDAVGHVGVGWGRSCRVGWVMQGGVGHTGMGWVMQGVGYKVVGGVGLATLTCMTHPPSITPVV